jgi:glyoxylase-like metal-dependent hydrolase (beta-lactamase superfamily II)
VTSPAPEAPEPFGTGPARRPLPPVEQVRPGLWSIPVPLPNTSLRYVLVYVLATDAGPYLVDAGWDTDDAFDTLAAGLDGIGTRVEDVRGVLVTHVHPDHYGLAGRVREASGAWIGLHPADAALIPRFEAPDPGRLATLLRRCGAPEETIERERAQLRALATTRDIPRPDVLMEDGCRPEVPGWDLTAIHTPGHSPGHLCFWEPRHRLMLSGDHVLPRITPNVPPPVPGGAEDPLGDFLNSLDLLRGRGASEVLPAHEHRFKDLEARLDSIGRHHDRRFEEVVDALREGAEVAWDVAARMRWSRPWAEMDGFSRRAAAGEAYAHLRALVRRGVVRETPGETVRWAVAAG